MVTANIVSYSYFTMATVPTLPGLAKAPKTIPLLGPNAERWSYDPHFQCLNWKRRVWGERGSIGFQETMVYDMEI